MRYRVPEPHLHHLRKMATGRRDGSPERRVQDLGYAEEQMSVGQYLATRLSTLAPPMNPAPNPIKALMLLNRQQWLFFLV